MTTLIVAFRNFTNKPKNDEGSTAAMVPRLRKPVVLTSLTTTAKVRGLDCTQQGKVRVLVTAQTNLIKSGATQSV